MSSAASSSRIQALPQHVVDRIAAGEVIQRPFSAVKELIENCVDAGATQVTVTVKGATQSIQVQDNGKGIHADDLAVICRRFNTSKLREFEDLKQMSTYGFRGEALSSITHVARVTITSQQPNQVFSLRAEYNEGRMTSSEPVKVAGNPGTTITVEDLFYNVPQRLRALKSSGEEYTRVIEVVSRYALLYSGRVGFTCKRAGVHSPDVHTQAGISSVRDNVRKLFGGEVAKELLEFKVVDEEQGFTLEGWVTNPNYSRKRGEFVLFINGRLVDSHVLKRTCDACYVECLPKGMHPFVMLKLDLAKDTVDVNIHPTKREVAFLHEEAICTALTKALRDTLLSGSQSRTFETSRMLSTSAKGDLSPPPPPIAGVASPAPPPARAKTPPSKQVRTDSSQSASGGLDRYLVSSSASPAAGASSQGSSSTPDDDAADDDGDQQRRRLIVPNGDALDLESVRSLHNAITANGDADLTAALRRSVFVGVVDDRFSLLQYDTNLVAVDHHELAQELFYQRVLSRFGRFDGIKLDPPIDLLQLVGGREKLLQCLVSKRALLHEYFYISISAEGKLQALPRLFSSHVPLAHSLPGLFRVLGGGGGEEEEDAAAIDWSNETDCFRSIARAIARAYALLPEFRVLVNTNGLQDALSIVDRNTLQYAVKNVLFPLMRRRLVVPQTMADPTNRRIVPLARLEQLYKIFERC